MYLSIVSKRNALLLLGQRTVKADSIRNLEDEEHGDGCLQRSLIVSAHEIGNDCSLDDQSHHAAKDSSSHIVLPREEIDEKHGHNIETLCES